MTQKNLSKHRSEPDVRHVPRNERGQIIPLAALMLGTLFCVCGFVMDIGRVYVGFHQLQASTDAAALAGGNALNQPGSTTTSTADAALLYSSGSGGTNTSGVLTSVHVTTSVGCITMVSSAPFSIPCFGAESGSTGYNAVQVTQTANVPVTFANFFGAGPVPISATATATMAGVPLTQYNVAIIVDTTASMASSDGGSTCSGSRLSCALSGVKVLLGGLYPCSISLGCGNTYTTGEPTNTFDHVNLFTFPNVNATAANSVTDDTNCSGTSPTHQGYTFPSATPGISGYNPAVAAGGFRTGTTEATYQVTGWLSNFRTSNTSSGTTLLNASSPIVDAAGGKSGCSSMAAPGGAGTFYAGVIYAAQQSLVAEQALYPGSQNLMILISDGDASSGYVTSPPSSSRNTYSTDMPGASLTASTYTTTTTGGVTTTTVGVIDQCGQAVTAAAAAKAAGTHIYAIAYGAESSGCATDTLDTYTPCTTMKAIASLPLNQYFFSDYAGTGSSSSCVGAADSTTSINQIFGDILADLSVSRLIPNYVNNAPLGTWTAANP
jgi:hypothetical protein